MFVDDDTYIMDTPGFSSLYTEGIEAEDLKLYFLRLQHIQEPANSICVIISVNRDVW